MSRITRIVASLALGLVFGSLVGCGSMTTAPLPSQTAPAASAASVSTPATDATDAGNATSLGGSTTSTSGLLSPLTLIFRSLIGLIVRVLNVVGSIGGTLTNGRWRVDVPAYAIDGTASIGLGVSSTTSADCALEIVPATQNHFAVPVRLTASCPAVPNDQLANYVIFWYDPGTGKWVPVAGSTVDLVHKTVSAPLQHFSRYAVGPADGKAGW
jgi:hypothetical protein